MQNFYKNLKIIIAGLALSVLFSYGFSAMAIPPNPPAINPDLINTSSANQVKAGKLLVGSDFTIATGANLEVRGPNDQQGNKTGKMLSTSLLVASNARTTGILRIYNNGTSVPNDTSSYASKVIVGGSVRAENLGGGQNPGGDLAVCADSNGIYVLCAPAVIEHTLTIASSSANTVSVSVNPPGTPPIQPGCVPGLAISTPCLANFAENTDVTITATPPGAGTLAWTGCDSNPTVNSCKLNMGTTNKNVFLNFTAQVNPVLTVVKTGSGAGTVRTTSTLGGSTYPSQQINCGSICSKVYTTGTITYLRAIPDSSSTFVNWSCSGAGCSGSSSCTSANGNNYCQVTMNGNTTVTANFAVAPKILTIQDLGLPYLTPGTLSNAVTVSPTTTFTAGSDSRKKSGSYAGGTSVTLTANPPSGYSFLGWSGYVNGAWAAAGTGLGGACANTTGSCTLTMDANKDVGAHFGQTTCTTWTTGSYSTSFTVPSTIAGSTITAELWGGGGFGAAGGGGGALCRGGGGGGGSAGGYTTGTISVTPGQVISASAGKGGGTFNATAEYGSGGFSRGGTTTFGTLSAIGGNSSTIAERGERGQGTNNQGEGGSGGTGGGATGSNGTFGSCTSNGAAGSGGAGGSGTYGSGGKGGDGGGRGVGENVNGGMYNGNNGNGGFIKVSYCTVQ